MEIRINKSLSSIEQGSMVTGKQEMFIYRCHKV
jgi:hypothetical protein